jgi:subtilisin family serine protease
MRKQIRAARAASTVCMGILATGAAAAPAFADAPIHFAKQPVADEFIVVFQDGSDVPALMQKMQAWSGAEPMFQYEQALPGGAFRMTESEAHLAAKMPGVAFLEQNAVVELAADVSVPQPNYGLDNLTAAAGYRSSFDGSGVNIYVLDTGVAEHNGFGSRLRLLADLVEDGQNGNDCSGHGTRVAGLVAGNPTGPAQAAKIISTRIFGCEGGTTNAVLIMGFDRIMKDAAANPEPDILQGSLSGDASDASDMAANRVAESGVVTVISAGNDGRDACLNSPGRAERVISVGAVDDRFEKASFSNFGRCVTLYAGGVGVLSLSNRGPTALEPGTGTSFSAPLVAGAAALVLQEGLSKGQRLTPAQVKERLIALSTPGQIPGLPPAENRLARVP